MKPFGFLRAPADSRWRAFSSFFLPAFAAGGEKSNVFGIGKIAVAAMSEQFDDFGIVKIDLFWH